MANVRCKMCGGNLNVEEGQQTVECEYCGSLQTVPAQIDNEKILNLHNRANALRLKQDFELAIEEMKMISTLDIGKSTPLNS